MCLLHSCHKHTLIKKMSVEHVSALQETKKSVIRPLLVDLVH